MARRLPEGLELVAKKHTGKKIPAADRFNVAMD